MENFHKLMITITHIQSNLLVKFTLPYINIVIDGTFFWNRCKKNLNGILEIFYLIFHLNVKKGILDLD
jgi:hypothetical protein